MMFSGSKHCSSANYSISLIIEHQNLNFSVPQFANEIEQNLNTWQCVDEENLCLKLEYKSELYWLGCRQFTPVATLVISRNGSND